MRRHCGGGKSFVTGGREHVRRVLYMALKSARRFNPVIAEFYDRLISQGKDKPVALIACMRKMLTILNALMRYDLFEVIDLFVAINIRR